MENRICVNERQVGLARALNVSFSALFSRNFMNGDANENRNFLEPFQEDKFLFVFVENYKREINSPEYETNKCTKCYRTGRVDYKSDIKT